MIENISQYTIGQSDVRWTSVPVSFSPTFFARVILPDIYFNDVHKIETQINSLHSNEAFLKTPMPVVIEYDDDCFIASLRDSNIGMSGDTAAEALELLRARVALLYVLYTNEKILGPGPRQQLDLLEKYVGKGREQDRATRSRQHRNQTRR